MKIAAFGCGKYFNLFILNKDNDVLGAQMDVVCIADNNPEIQGHHFLSIPIIQPSELNELIVKDSIEAVVVCVAWPNAGKIVTQLYDLDVSIPIYTVNLSNDNRAFLQRYMMSKPILPYIECDLVAHCNLKCNGCGHGSNIANESYLDIDIFTKDFKRLAELYSNILTIRLMGGEPLLHPNLKEFIRTTRRLFEKANIRLVTNGLLLPDMDEAFFACIKENNIIIDISLYFPTFKKWFDIKKALCYHGISYSLGEPVNRFMRGLDLVPQDYREVFKNCTYSCITISNGYISRCGIERGVRRLNEYFHEHFWEDSSMPSLINIHDDVLDGVEINHRLNEPFPACAYCRSGDWQAHFLSDEKLTKRWRCNEKPVLSDWCYGMEEE